MISHNHHTLTQVREVHFIIQLLKTQLGEVMSPVFEKHQLAQGNNRIREALRQNLHLSLSLSLSLFISPLDAEGEPF